MDLRASYPFPAPASKVWDLLIDPAVVAACLPGCDALEPVGEDRYRARLTVGLAAISGSYEGTVAILDKQPPRAYRMLVEGSGRTGFVKGEANVELVEEGGATEVRVQGRAQVGGLMARVGQRLLGSASKMMMDRFFACLAERAARE